MPFIPVICTIIVSICFLLFVPAFIIKTRADIRGLPDPTIDITIKIFDWIKSLFKRSKGSDKLENKSDQNHS